MKITPRRFCTACGYVVPPRDLACPACKSTATPSTKWVQPHLAVEIPQLDLPFPWQALALPYGGSLLLHGPEGVGKTTATSLLHQPQAGSQVAGVIHSEQDPHPIAATYRRLGIAVPRIWSITRLDNPLPEAERALESLAAPAGHWVIIDSLSPFKLAAEELVASVLSHARSEGWRVAFVAQETKDGKIAGPSSLPYIVDVVAPLARDFMGNILLGVRKTRYGAPWMTYFRLDEAGKVGPCDFTRTAYSIEGDHPEYRIAAYGTASGSVAGQLGGARGRTLQWAGLLDCFARAGIIDRYLRTASAGIQTPLGLYEPDDWSLRAHFAAQVGLHWVSAVEGTEALEAAGFDVRTGKSKKKSKSPDEDAYGEDEEDEEDEVVEVVA